MRRPLLLVLLVIAVLGAGCNDDPSTHIDRGAPADPATASVHVHFTDSSVPPEYHRSWDLELDQQRVRLVVDSYGDVIARKTVKMPRAKWERFVADLADHLDTLDDPEAVDPGCTGGTTMSLQIEDAAAWADTSMEVENCASDHNRAVSQRIGQMVKQFTDLVDLEALTRT